jgi:hypothetical protein
MPIKKKPVTWTRAAIKLDFAQTSRKNNTVSDNKKVEAEVLNYGFWRTSDFYRSHECGSLSHITL